jgi:hypothetical protein
MNWDSWLGAGIDDHGLIPRRNADLSLHYIVKTGFNTKPCGVEFLKNSM